MEIFENNMFCDCRDEDMVMPYSPMSGIPHPCPMPEPMPYPCPMPEPMPYPCPMPGPMPYPPMKGMPHPCPMPYPPMNGMPHPYPMPGPMPMPIEECNEETLHHMEKMYCMHMYMSAMNKTEAYRHKMMHCYCKHHMKND